MVAMVAIDAEELPIRFCSRTAVLLTMAVSLGTGPGGRSTRKFWCDLSAVLLDTIRCGRISGGWTPLQAAICASVGPGRFVTAVARRLVLLGVRSSNGQRGRQHGQPGKRCTEDLVASPA